MYAMMSSSMLGNGLWNVVGIRTGIRTKLSAADPCATSEVGHSQTQAFPLHSRTPGTVFVSVLGALPAAGLFVPLSASGALGTTFASSGISTTLDALDAELIGVDTKESDDEELLDGRGRLPPPSPPPPPVVVVVLETSDATEELLLEELAGGAVTIWNVFPVNGNAVHVPPPSSKVYELEPSGVASDSSRFEYILNDELSAPDANIGTMRTSATLQPKANIRRVICVFI